MLTLFLLSTPAVSEDRVWAEAKASESQSGTRQTQSRAVQSVVKPSSRRRLPSVQNQDSIYLFVNPWLVKSLNKSAYKTASGLQDAVKPSRR